MYGQSSTVLFNVDSLLFQKFFISHLYYTEVPAHEICLLTQTCLNLSTRSCLAILKSFCNATGTGLVHAREENVVDSDSCGDVRTTDWRKPPPNVFLGARGID